MRESNLGGSIGRRGLGAPGDGVTSLGTGGEPLTLGGTSVAAPFVVVGISRGERHANQARHVPSFDFATIVGGSAIAGRRGRSPSSDGVEYRRLKGMAKPDPSGDADGQSERIPHRVRLPGFIVRKEIGLGDVIKRATSYVGIKPCGGCERRATALNRRVTFTPRRGR
jgi:hypothetical protein